MSKTGRNAPCPCGSDDILDEAWETFWLWRDDTPPTHLATGHYEAFIPWFFYEWYPDPHDEESILAPDTALANGVAAGYLAQYGTQIDPAEYQFLNDRLETVFSFHEILSIQPDQGLTVRDLLTGERHEIADQQAARTADEGGILFARVLSTQQATRFDGISPRLIPPEDKLFVLRLRRWMHKQSATIDIHQLRDACFEILELYHDLIDTSDDRLAPDGNELTDDFDDDLDSDLFYLQQSSYDIDDPQAAFDALRALAGNDFDRETLLAEADYDSDGMLHAVEIPWIDSAGESAQEDGSAICGFLVIHGTRLTAETDSAARADALQDLVKTHLPNARATDPDRNDEDDETLLPYSPFADPSLTPEEQEERAQKLLIDHYNNWADEPQWLLNTDTPRQAMADADGRSIVEILLSDLAHNLPEPLCEASPGLLTDIRRELGL